MEEVVPEIALFKSAIESKIAVTVPEIASIPSGSEPRKPPPPRVKILPSRPVSIDKSTLVTFARSSPPSIIDAMNAPNLVIGLDAGADKKGTVSGVSFDPIISIVACKSWLFTSKEAVNFNTLQPLYKKYCP